MLGNRAAAGSRLSGRIGGGVNGNYSDSDDGGRFQQQRRSVYHSDSDDGGRGRLSLPRSNHSDSEDGGGSMKPQRGKNSGYYSEGEMRTRRMPRLSENVNDEDDELRTLSES